ncbi:hypothetical protein pipiens_016564, partial [Culex pipiens pipiens]
MDITEVQFIGSKVFHIDADLVSDTWHGKNVAGRAAIANMNLPVLQPLKVRTDVLFVVLTLLENNKNTLAQVSTGEGKSLIVVAVAIIKASQGQKVDIITSSSVLAKRDAEQSKSIYAKFGINVSHNCSEDIEKRKEAYSGNQVVYGDLSSFQRDYLLHKFYQKNVLGDRDFVNVIVDEVDSMLLDRGNNMLYLSHDLPDMDKLESVYVFIWEWVNNISKVYDTAAIRDAVLWQLYGVLKCTDIGKIDATLSEEKRNFIWNKLVEAKIIDGDGKLMTENIKNDVLGELLGSEYSVYLDRLEYLLTEYINREKCIHVPNYLRSFVDLHLESWIEAAKMALVMEAGHDYVVDVDRSGSSADRTPNITILDRDTGTDLVNSQWEAALHQFVQLKHGCKTYLQSLKAVFISNVTFLKLYDKLYGLSGTLGSHRERDLLEEIYAVDFVNVPTAKCKLFYEYVPIVCKSAADWIDTIIESAKRLTETDGRSVLIICETLNEVAELYKVFGGKNATNVRTYTREYEEFDTGELSPGQIIIATNLAGRGTDIKLTQKLKGAGGVHVCLTYLPSNIRVEQQAFGRAARCGFVEEAIVNLKAQLHEKLDVLLQQTIHRPVQERGRFLLLNYAEGQIELQTDSNDGPNPGEDIAKKIRIGQLKKESDKRRQALAMTPVENLLDQQFNEALAKWEQSSTELERLAVCIRKGEPVDGQYLDICLDAVRFVLLRRAVVVSNICVNLMTD